MKPVLSTQRVLQLLMILAAIQSATAASAEATVNNVISPILINGFQEDELLVFPSDEKRKTTLVEAKRFISIAEKRLSSEAFERIVFKKIMIDGTEAVDIRSIEKAGRNLEISYNESTLELSLKIPPELQNPINFSLGKSGRENLIGKNIEPSLFSSHINLYATQPIDYSVDGSFIKRDPLNLSLEAAGNLASNSIDADLSYSEDDEYKWKRNDVTYTRDIEDLMLRITAGDITYPSNDYQTFRPTGGLSITRNFDLQPYRIFSPTGTRELVIRTPSTVTVLLNNRPYRKIQLPAGRYNLENLSFTNGINNMKFIITDAAGRSETTTINYFFEPDLLTKGLHQFSYNIGFPSARKNAGYTYDSGRTTVSLFHRMGAARYYTPGIGLQADTGQWTASTDHTFGSVLGTFRFDLAAGSVDHDKIQTAQKITYTYRDYEGPGSTQRGAGFWVERLDPRFSKLGQMKTYNITSYQLGAQFSRQLFYGTSAALLATYDFNRETEMGHRNAYKVVPSISRSWKNGIHASLLFSYAKTSLRQIDRSCFIFITWHFPATNQQMNITAETETRTLGTGWQYSSGGRSNHKDFAVRADRTDDSREISARASYMGNRGNIAATHTVSKNYPGEISNRTELRTATSVAFSGNTIAMGRPVGNSFAIVNRPDSWKDQTININPEGNDSQVAQINNWGPALVPDVIPYRNNVLDIDGSSLEMGYSLNNESFILTPSYKSGYLIEPCREATLFMEGRIVDRKGHPVRLVAGRMYSLTDKNWEEIEFFTDRAGNFQMSGLKQGRYEIVLAGGNWKPARIKVSRIVRKIFNIGDIVVIPAR